MRLNFADRDYAALQEAGFAARVFNSTPGGTPDMNVFRRVVQRTSSRSDGTSSCTWTPSTSPSCPRRSRLSFRFVIDHMGRVKAASAGPNKSRFERSSIFSTPELLGPKVCGSERVSARASFSWHFIRFAQGAGQRRSQLLAGHPLAASERRAPHAERRRSGPLPLRDLIALANELRQKLLVSRIPRLFTISRADAPAFAIPSGASQVLSRKLALRFPSGRAVEESLLSSSQRVAPHQEFVKFVVQGS